MNLIAVVDKKWGIGKDGSQLVTIPEDMKFFRQETIGKVLVLGRKTLETFPGGRPLESRVNIVLTRDANFKAKDTIVCHSVDEVLEEVKKYDTDDVYVVGGGSVYEQMLPMCKVAHITKVDYTYDADTYFPDLDKCKDWKITETSDEKTYFDLCYEFVKYERA